MPFSREESFLIAASTLHLSPSRLETLDRLMRSSSLRWDQLLQEADFHGIAPLIFHHLCKNRPDRKIPLEPRRALEEIYERILAVNICLLDEFDRIASTFASKGVPLIALKGIYFADHIYPSIALRPMTDIDLLVQFHDLDLAHDLLVGLGFRPRFADRLETYRRLHFHLPYVKEQPFNLIVEVHWDLAQESHIKFNMDSAWEESASAKTSRDIPYLTLSPIDTFCYSAVHSAHNFYNQRLIWMVDLATLLTIYKAEIKKELLRAKLCEQKIGAMVYFSLKTLERIHPEALESLFPLSFRIGKIQKYLITAFLNLSDPFNRTWTIKPLIQGAINGLFIEGKKERYDYFKEKVYRLLKINLIS